MTWARLPLLLIVPLGAVSLAARLGGLHWLGDMFGLLADYYLWAALLLASLALAARLWRWAAAAGLIVLLNAQLIAGAPVVPAPAGLDPDPQLRLLVYNIYHQNPDLGAVVETVRRYDPDLVFLMEYSDAIQAQIEAAFADYPYRLVQPSRMTMGLALFSRLPIESATIHRSPATRIPIFQAELLVGGRRVSFVGGHPWPPQPRWGGLHRAQMQEITRVAGLAEPPLIVAGDFNAAPWSYTLAQLGQASGARQVRGRLDLTKTWSPAPLFGLPLDHVLAGPEWQVLGHAYGDPGGSDHLPLVVDLALMAE